MDEAVDHRTQLQALMDVRPAQTIAVLNHLGVADLLADGPLSVDELAEKTDTHPLTLYRLLRYSAMHGAFSEVQPRHFALTPMAQFLRSDHPESARWRVKGDTSVKPWLPWQEWLETVTTGEPAYDRMHGRTYWEALNEDADARAVFDLSLRAIGERQIPAVLPLLDLTDRAVLVDVGCGEAGWLAALLRAFPNLRGVAADLEQARSSAERTIRDHGLNERAGFHPTDFFGAVPDGDVLLLANVLHDWPDDRALEILRACKTALRPGGIVVIVERVIPEGDEPHHGKGVDINMLFLLGGRERTLTEFGDLLTEADLRLDSHLTTSLPVSVVIGRH